MRPWFIVQIPSDFTILIHASARNATIDDGKRIANLFILIHASARDATAKSYKIGNNFTVLVRKFVQIFDILILHISIFLEKQEQYFFIFHSYIVCQNIGIPYFSAQIFFYKKISC